VKYHWAQEIQVKIRNLHKCKPKQKWLPSIKENIGYEVIQQIDVDSGINVVSSGQSRVSSLVNIISYDLVPKMVDSLSSRHFKGDKSWLVVMLNFNSDHCG
jgi:hypothetical protein